jgi:hypothetical protein
MCWWKTISVRALVAVLLLICAGSARGEAILRLEHSLKTKSPAKTKNNSFSLRAISARDDSEFDRYAPYLLSGRKEQPQVHLAGSNKKAPELAIQWDDKHARKFHLKGLKVVKKPVRVELPHEVTVKPESIVPMAGSGQELPASVPAPKPLWAGIGMIAAIGTWRWFVRRGLVS